MLRDRICIAAGNSILKEGRKLEVAEFSDFFLRDCLGIFLILLDETRGWNPVIALRLYCQLVTCWLNTNTSQISSLPWPTFLFHWSLFILSTNLHASHTDGSSCNLAPLLFSVEQHILSACGHSLCILRQLLWL